MNDEQFEEVARWFEVNVTDTVGFLAEFRRARESEAQLQVLLNDAEFDCKALHAIRDATICRAEKAEGELTSERQLNAVRMRERDAALEQVRVLREALQNTRDCLEQNEDTDTVALDIVNDALIVTMPKKGK